jgi:predicted metal-binding membrane protein
MRLREVSDELTPFKDACLNRCRGPLDLLAERRRDGLGGVLRIGLEHGAWCVGCCWALMVALFALGSPFRRRWARAG